MSEKTLESWCVVYRDADATSFDVEVFKCKAESYEHAEEQCENAYPESDILWLLDTGDESEAIDNWLTGGGIIENESSLMETK